jgi:hypothetical protein
MIFFDFILISKRYHGKTWVPQLRNSLNISTILEFAISILNWKRSNLPTYLEYECTIIHIIIFFIRERFFECICKCSNRNWLN